MLNWSRVEELREEVGEDAFAEVVDLFLEEVEETMNGLTPGSDAPTYESLLHFLKGAAMNLGFDEFADLCRRGENTARGGKTDGIDPDVIKASFIASRDAFLEKVRDAGYLAA